MLNQFVTMKCLNWNVEWRTPRSAGGKWIAQKIRELGPDVSCLTEVTEALIPEGEVLRSDLDYGYLKRINMHSL